MPVTNRIVPTELTLGVADIDATEQFYRDILGVEMIRLGDAVRITFGAFTLVFEHAPPTERAKFELGLRVLISRMVDPVVSPPRVDLAAGPCRASGLVRCPPPGESSKQPRLVDAAVQPSSIAHVDGLMLA